MLKRIRRPLLAVIIIALVAFGVFGFSKLVQPTELKKEILERIE